jgi:hypothetical protein
MPRLGGCCHQLLGIYYATHLAPRLGGWIRHGSQGISMPWFFGSFIRNLEDLDSKLGVCRDTCHQRLIFWIFWKIRTEDLTTTQGMSTSQPWCSQGSTQKTPSIRNLGELEDTFRSTRKPAVLDYEELGGLLDPSQRDCAHGLHITR